MQHSVYWSPAKPKDKLSDVAVTIFFPLKIFYLVCRRNFMDSGDYHGLKQIQIGNKSPAKIKRQRAISVFVFDNFPAEFSLFRPDGLSQSIFELGGKRDQICPERSSSEDLACCILVHPSSVLEGWTTQI